MKDVKRLLPASAGSPTVALLREEGSGFSYPCPGDFPAQLLQYTLHGAALDNIMEATGGPKCCSLPTDGQTLSTL